MQVYDLFKWEIAHTWALSKDPSAAAGVINSPYSCPLAQCFSELLEQPVKALSGRWFMEVPRAILDRASCRFCR
jgi:hypothetical protein